MIALTARGRIEREAAAWIARLHAEDCSSADRDRFRVWVARDPRHASAFDAMTSAWDALGALPRSAAASPRPAVSRRAVLAGLGVAGFGAGGALLLPAAALDLRTGFGERRAVDLDDGSHLLLDTETHARFRLTKDARDLQMRQGRLSCRIAPDARPFVTAIGEHRILAYQASFDAVCGARGDLAGLLVMAGDVTVDGPQGHVTMVAGQALRAGVAAPFDVAPDMLRQATAWQSGRAMFQGERLSGVADQMNRYDRVQLRILDARVGEMKVSGVFRVGDNRAFAQTLEAMLPVRLAAGEGVIAIAMR